MNDAKGCLTLIIVALFIIVTLMSCSEYSADKKYLKEKQAQLEETENLERVIRLYGNNYSN